MNKRPGTIQITVPAADERTAQLDMANVAMGPTADLNGEVTDATARLVADHWRNVGPDGLPLTSLAAGFVVDRALLLDDISATARGRQMLYAGSWPRELELLSTWVINHN